MLTSIIARADLEYPEPDDKFSPSVRYPEYPFSQVSARPNAVYGAIRDCLLQAGLDAPNCGSEAWNPLGAYIAPGSSVFVLCNFVYHQRPNESRRDFLAKCTHGSVVRAVIDYVRIATGPLGRIAFGNAPLQSCSWEHVLRDTESDVTLQFYAENGVNVEAKDLRLLVAERSVLGQIAEVQHRPRANGIVVELDAQSALNALYADAVGERIAFRVSDYNPDQTESFHGRNRHRYIINKAILVADVVVSVPKLKTHEKVGITVGMKGMVGCVGDKNCLAHHRFGSPAMKGDEFPEDSQARVLLSRFHDFVYRRSYPSWIGPLLEIVDENARRVVRRMCKRIQAGAWHGNDTAWRMTLDLTRIMHLADHSGRMAEEVQRRHIVFIDAVVAGEGEGPLAPTAVSGRTVAFSDDLVLGDIGASLLMGYHPTSTPVVRAAMNDATLNVGLITARCVMNGALVPLTRVASILGRPFVAPSGWRGVLG